MRWCRAADSDLEFLIIISSNGGMNDRTTPVYARRLRLSTGAICAALLLTGAAVLAVFQALGPSSVVLVPQDAVPVETPLRPAHASEMPSDRQQASSADARLQPIRR